MSNDVEPPSPPAAHAPRPPAADSGGTHIPPWVRPGRMAAAPVRPGVLVAAVIGALVIIIVTIALVGSSGSAPTAAPATASGNPPLLGGLPPSTAAPTTPSPPPAGSGAPMPPASGPGSGLDPAGVFAATVPNTIGGPSLHRVIANHGEGCAVHIANGQLVSGFQQAGCQTVVSATYLTDDGTVYVGVLVFTFGDPGAAAAQGEAAGGDDQNAFRPLLPTGTSAASPQIAAQSIGDDVLVTVSWYENGARVTPPDPRLSEDSAPVTEAVKDRLENLAPAT